LWANRGIEFVEGDAGGERSVSHSSTLDASTDARQGRIGTVGGRR
jgi:hypothetical protein